METMREAGRRGDPFSVYRTLEYLQAIGLARRAESLNADWALGGQ